MSNKDVPSPIDFHDPIQAKEWERKTIEKKPWRPQFFSAFVSVLNDCFPQPISVLELGSGPGHLAEQLVHRCHIVRYVALDFSPAMHDLARGRIGAAIDTVEYLERDFRLPDWPDGLGHFDAVITMQAAHEVRHKRHLQDFLVRARHCIAPEGLLLYCDHYFKPGDTKNPDLFFPLEDQSTALETAGFSKVRMLLDLEGMALFAATNAK